MNYRGMLYQGIIVKNTHSIICDILNSLLDTKIEPYIFIRFDRNHHDVVFPNFIHDREITILLSEGFINLQVYDTYFSVFLDIPNSLTKENDLFQKVVIPYDAIIFLTDPTEGIFISSDPHNQHVYSLYNKLDEIEEEYHRTEERYKNNEYANGIKLHITSKTDSNK